MQSSLPKIIIGGKDLARFFYGPFLRILSPTPQNWGSGGLQAIRDSVAEAQGRDYNGVVLAPVRDEDDIKIGQTYLYLTNNGRILMKEILILTGLRPWPNGPSGAEQNWVWNTSAWPNPPGGEGCFHKSHMTQLDRGLILRYFGPTPNPYRVYSQFEALWRLAQDFEHMAYPYAYLLNAQDENLAWTRCKEFFYASMSRKGLGLALGGDLNGLLRQVRNGVFPPYMETVWNPAAGIDKVTPFLQQAQSDILARLAENPSKLVVFTKDHKCEWPGEARMIFLRSFGLPLEDRSLRLALVKQLIMITSDADQMVAFKDIESRLTPETT